MSIDRFRAVRKRDAMRRLGDIRRTVEKSEKAEKRESGEEKRECGKAGKR
jgi:hypothetical protein